MVAHICTIAFQGIDVLPIDVQVQISPGLPYFTIVGLPDKAVAESRERIRASFQAIGLALPLRRITVNLAPADVQKEGSHYDLPIALGLMVTMNVITAEDVASYTVLGELGLDGSLAAVAGTLAAAIDAAARDRGLICPKVCGAEAAWSGNPDILAPESLVALINHFKGTQVLTPPTSQTTATTTAAAAKLHYDFSDIKGQESTKRALEVAAAGGHHVLMVGSPGAGKSMLAQRLITILPPLEPQEALEVTIIHSMAGLLPESGLVRQRPFRDPHHSASLPALIGGGIPAVRGRCL
jgi:magnesium chelatase family protein